MTNKESFQNTLKINGLRVTPQRLVVLEALSSLRNHPSAEEICDYIRKEHSNISTATIYNILESFVKKGILSHVKTDKGAMIYDSITENHHHIYDQDSTLINDYYDIELDSLLEAYFKKNRINGFEIEKINLQIQGKYKVKNK